jgi:hypothetical protein
MTTSGSINVKKLADLWSAISEATKDSPPSPYQIISGSGHGWFLDPSTKSMVKVPRGTEIVQVTEKPDKRGKVIARAEHRYIMISPDEIIDVGYN